MTFYEAALKVLEEAGAPLHAQEITKRSLDKGLLSHVGKSPDVVMLARLTALAKRTRDRRVVVTAKDTFALSEWMLDEDAQALAETGVLEKNPEEALPPIRGSERHPEPRAEYLRNIGRQAERKRRSEEQRGKRFPPVAEVVFDVLSESNAAFVPQELLARLKARELVTDDLNQHALIEALVIDNQSRAEQGRKVQFFAVRSEDNQLQLSVDTVTDASTQPIQAQATFCAAVGIPFENGRAILKSQQRESKRHSEAVVQAGEVITFHSAKQWVRDYRRGFARTLRQKLMELEHGTLEKACVRMLYGLHFREIKVSKRAREFVVLTARKRDGSLDLRYSIRVAHTDQVDRKLVQDCRRDLQHFSANIAVLLSIGECRGEAKAEAVQSGAVVYLWAGEGLAEKFMEAQVGVMATQVELFEIDQPFFDQAATDALEAQKRREERNRDRDRGGGNSGADASGEHKAPSDGSDESRSSREGDASDAAAAPAAAASAEASSSDDDGGDDDGDEGDEGGEQGGARAEGGAGAEGAGAEGEGQRRRRRRRRRRRGNRPEGAQTGGVNAAGGGAAGEGGSGGAGESEGARAESAAPSAESRPESRAEARSDPSAAPTPPMSTGGGSAE